MRLNFNKNRYLVAAAAAVLVFGGGAFYFFDYRSPKEEISQVPRAEAPETDGGPATGGELKTPPAAPPPAAKTLPPYTGQPLRELTTDPQMAVSLGVVVVEKYRKNLAAIAERLEKDPKNYDDWLGIAYIKKLFSNYIGARDAWEYAKIVGEDNPTAYFNLGELYGYEFKEPPKAEENYKAALRLNPYSFDYYVGLANFYEDVLKDFKKTEEVLLSALDKIPHTEPNLFATIGAFYRDQKDYPKAIEYFEKALEAAEKMADPAIKKAIQNEIDYIRSKQ